MSTEYGARVETRIDNERAHALLSPRVATVYERIDARFVDGILAVGILGVLFALALLWTGDVAAARWYGPVAAYFALPMVEFVCISYRGATPGKALKRMRVASLWSATGQPTQTQAFVRAIVVQTLALSVFAWWPLVFVYVLSPFTNRDRRGLHDVAAGTVVIRQSA